jgi:cytochrome P450
MRGLVPKLLAQRAGCPASSPNWLDGLAAEQLSMHELTDGLNHLYGAYNAVDFAVTAALFELSRHAHWRDRLRVELESVLGGRRFPTMDDVPRLPLLWGAIREVLRLYPVAGGIFRQTGAPLEFDSEHVESGTQVVILPYALHRHPEYWERPDSFDPERWTRTARPSPPFAYLPFLTGPRKCMGQPLAELVLLVVLSTLIRDFDVDVLKAEAPLTPYLVPRFATDLPFAVRRVDQSAHQPAA